MSIGVKKISVRIYETDLRYLKEHPVEDLAGRRIVPYNETIRELIHGFVAELKEMRGHK